MKSYVLNFILFLGICVCPFALFAQDLDPYEISLEARHESWQKNYKEAKALYESVLKTIDPTYQPALFGLAEIAYWQGHFKESQRRLQVLLKHHPNDEQGLQLAEKLKKAKKDQTEKTLRVSYFYQDVSFADSTHHPKLEFQYNQKRKWNLGANFSYWDKFSTEFFDFGVNGGVWFGENTYLSVDAQWAPDQGINPQQAYQFQIDQIVLKKWVPTFSYKIADYQGATVHIFSPGFTWYFLPRWNWTIKYYLSVTVLSEDFVNHAFMSKLGWNVIDPFSIFAGYSLTNENFEAGSPFNPFGSFRANVFFGGMKYQFKNGFGLDLGVNYEDRDNGTHVLSSEFGMFFKW